jgi:hypothetical protein
MIATLRLYAAQQPASGLLSSCQGGAWSLKIALRRDVGTAALHAMLVHSQQLPATSSMHAHC